MCCAGRMLRFERGLLPPAVLPQQQHLPTLRAGAFARTDEAAVGHQQQIVQAVRALQGIGALPD